MTRLVGAAVQFSESCRRVARGAPTREASRSRWAWPLAVRFIRDSSLLRLWLRPASCDVNHILRRTKSKVNSESNLALSVTILLVVKRRGGESLAVDVFAALRAEIFDRRFSPGERLKPVALAERFDVSIGVLREALGLLAAQHLVVIERNRGFHVTMLSRENLLALTFARKVNEGAALRLSVERGDVKWESEVLAAHHRLASDSSYRIDEDGAYHRNASWAAAHIAFHRALICACGNDVLLDICDRLSDAAELYRAWSGRAEPGRDIPGEHRALMEACLAHDADLAVARFERHVDRTASILLEHELFVVSDVIVG